MFMSTWEGGGVAPSLYSSCGAKVPERGSGLKKGYGSWPGLKKEAAGVGGITLLPFVHHHFSCLHLNSSSPFSHPPPLK